MVVLIFQGQVGMVGVGFLFFLIVYSRSLGGFWVFWFLVFVQYLLVCWFLGGVGRCRWAVRVGFGEYFVFEMVQDRSGFFRGGVRLGYSRTGMLFGVRRQRFVRFCIYFREGVSRQKQVFFGLRVGCCVVGWEI